MPERRLYNPASCMRMEAVMSMRRKITGTLAIPVITAAVLEIICLTAGQNVITNLKSFNNFMVYTAIVMITTMALSINLSSGRFDFSLGAMAALSSAIGAKLSYGLLQGSAGSAYLMLLLTIAAGALLGIVSGIIYVLLRIPPIITSLGVTLIYEGALYTLTGGKYVMAEVQNSSMSGFVGTEKNYAVTPLPVIPCAAY